MEDLIQNKITDFFLDVTETDEFKSVEYLIFSIRKQYLNYLSQARKKQFEIPKYLELLVDKAIDLFNLSGISCVDMLQYMLEHDINNWVHYYAYTFIIPIAQGKSIECVNDLSDLYALVMTGYILDDFGFNRLNIEEIVKGEQLTHKKNQYGLSVVNGVVFHNDYFVFENKAYLYNILTNIIPVSFGDVMPGFARVISEQREVGNILLRLDDRLALPEEQAISYSTLNFEKCQCGRTLVRMKKITGRSDDMLIIRGVNLFPSQIEHVLLEMGETSAHYMLYVDRQNNLDTLELQVELDESKLTDTIKDLQNLSKRIQHALNSAIGLSVKVTLVEPKTIARSEGKAVRVVDRRK